MDQGFHLSPNPGITLNFGVRLHEDAVPPGILFAVDRIRFVVEAEISEDVSACGIGGADLGFTVQPAPRLIEICGLGYVGGNELIILAGLRDAIHLNREQYRNAFFFERSRQRNGLGSAPAVSIQDDAGVPLFFGRE